MRMNDENCVSSLASGNANLPSIVGLLCRISGGGGRRLAVEFQKPSRNVFRYARERSGNRSFFGVSAKTFAFLKMAGGADRESVLASLHQALLGFAPAQVSARLSSRRQAMSAASPEGFLNRSTILRPRRDISKTFLLTESDSCCTTSVSSTEYDSLT